MGRALLDGIPFRIDPDQVNWSFRMKIADEKTLGGKVIQILGTELGDMTLSGVFGSGDPSQGDTMGWEDQDRFASRIKGIARAASVDGVPVRFVYSPRGWDFHVYIKGLDQQPYENATFNPRWTLTLFIVEDATGKVVKGIKDLYIQRLMAGIGWKQTAYNGPVTQADVNAVTGGDTAGYIEKTIQGVASGTAGSGQ